jgi:hypothetical protein
MRLKFRYWFLAILCLKIALLILFSSDYVQKLFIPFIEHFLSNFDNPWQYFYKNPTGAEFPYSPLMLYVLSFFYLPCWASGLTCLQHVVLKLPTLFSDLLIFWLLFKTFPNKVKEILIFIGLVLLFCMLRICTLSLI